MSPDLEAEFHPEADVIFVNIKFCQKPHRKFYSALFHEGVHKWQSDRFQLINFFGEVKSATSSSLWERERKWYLGQYIVFSEFWANKLQRDLLGWQCPVVSILEEDALREEYKRKLMDLFFCDDLCETRGHVGRINYPNPGDFKQWTQFLNNLESSNFCLWNDPWTRRSLRDKFCP